MSTFSDFFSPETVESIRGRMVAYARAAQLKVTDWIVGAVSQQILETVVQALFNGTASVSKLVRGYANLDSSTDPGDVDPFDADNAGLTPAPGFLSAKGSGDYGTDRIDATFATGTVTVTNGNGSPISFAPQQLTLTSSGAGNPTYRNSPDPSIYTNPDGTTTIAPGATKDIPVTCEQVGTAGNATPGQLSLTTSVATGVTATNAGSITGLDREPADAYRERCREAPALTSPNGPADSYRYLATTARDDGTFGNSKTGTNLGVTRVWVSPQSSIGAVQVYLATPSGKATGTQVTIPRSLITVSPGVIATPGAIQITIGVDTSNGANNVSVAITYTAKLKATSFGGAAGVYNSPGTAPVAQVFLAINAALDAFLAGVDINGQDQNPDGTGGVIFTEDLRGVIRAAWPTLYDVTTSAPAGASTPIGLGGVAIRGSTTGTLTAV